MHPAETDAAITLVELGLAEDLGNPPDDLTSRITIAPDATGAVRLVAREAGVLAGLPIVAAVFERLDQGVNIEPRLKDGARLAPGQIVADLSGPMRSLLTGERTALNFLAHLSGIASLTRRYVDAVAGAPATILDTRKTHAGYRLLEKYAVRAGGGHNHRIGLHDGCLIKDNHLAAWRRARPQASLAELVRHVRTKIDEVPLEVEVDRLEQLADVLGAAPDIVLLDNMPCDTLRQAVAIRDTRQPRTRLEASGGIRLATVADIAATGVDRISVGELTHSARSLDLGFDWAGEGP